MKMLLPPFIMKNSASPCCCQDETSADRENRRGFLGQAAAIACGAAALATPVVAGVVAFLNPLRQKSQGGAVHAAGFARYDTGTTARR